MGKGLPVPVTVVSIGQKFVPLRNSSLSVREGYSSVTSTVDKRAVRGSPVRDI